MPSVLVNRCAPLALLAVLIVGESASADHGMFLPDAPEGVTYGNVGGGGNPIEYSHDAFCPPLRIGGVMFTYDTYTTAAGGGAGLAGGFYLAPDLKVNDGHHLGWVQTVTATIAGANSWGIDVDGVDVGEFPDAGPNNPEYPFQQLPAGVTPPNPPGPPTKAFVDFPSRRFAEGVQSWRAELALVCFDDTPNMDGFIEGGVLFSFLWGFNVTVAPNGITDFGPQFFGPATPSFLTTLNDYYDGAAPNPPSDGRASSLFLFSNDCDDCFRVIPEPSSVVLVVIGSAGFGVHLYRRRGRSAA